ncbi:MAG: diguanylate cyclase [Geobacter sp.]|nr:diguanylate cyclase [Geobacter sp.]
MPQQIWPRSFQYFRNVKMFLISLCVIIALFLCGIFYLLYAKTTDLLSERMREQASTYADLLLHMKNWNYDYGGVYVEKGAGVESNRYLLGLGVNPDVHAEYGRVLTLRNHAIMMDEISRLSERNDGTRFRAVSRKPLSPGNVPDETEKTALRQFEQGSREFSRIEVDASGKPRFRYLLPLFVEASCMECHRSQGYHVGSVIGAISVSTPATQMMDEIGTNKKLVIAAAVLTITLLVGIVYFLTWRLVIKLDDAQKQLKKLASTDELTGLKNRRQIMQRLGEEFERSTRLDEPLCIIILDIDHFKRVNDTFGHPCGDQVLKQVALRISDSLRRYDSVGRIGGEEFMIVMPGAFLEDARTLAERQLHTIRNESFSDGQNTFSLTVSAGVSMLTASDKHVTTLIKRADNALYAAKQNGRDQVMVA